LITFNSILLLVLVPKLTPVTILRAYRKRYVLFLFLFASAFMKTIHNQGVLVMILYLTELKGKVLENVEKIDNEELWFYTTDGEVYRMYHEQNCCESVYIEDIAGDLGNLIGSPIMMAEKVTEYGDNSWGTYTWTFYKFATVKGYVTIRWYGVSNGYYSESVTFEQVEREGVWV
jgi:hypothetical protein